jgi:uncharacterized membrane protein
LNGKELKREMKVVPKQWDVYNPVLIFVGLVFVGAAGYALAFMGVSGPPIVWLLRVPFVILFLIGLIVLTRQFQLWRRSPDTRID